jgi:hypothetical protein
MPDATPHMHTAFVDGVAFWAPLVPGWTIARSVLRGESAPQVQPAPRPAPAILAPTERRRAPDTVAIALEIGVRACENAGADPRELASVFACTEGDTVISDYMCDTLARTPTLISPTRFHNSVHNAAAGYWSIGTGCTRPYTALSAHRDTFGEGLLEALVQAESDARTTLLVAYDIESRGPLATVAPSKGMVGAGVVLAPAAGDRSMARIRWRTAPGTERTGVEPRNAALVAGNAMAHCLPFFEALAVEEDRTVRLGLSPNLSLVIRFDFPTSDERRWS